MRLSELPVSIKYLAIQRAKEHFFRYKSEITEENWKRELMFIIEKDYPLFSLFSFVKTPEGLLFWNKIVRGDFDAYYVDYPLKIKKEDITVGSILSMVERAQQTFEEKKARENQVISSKICKIVMYKGRKSFIFLPRNSPNLCKVPITIINRGFREATDLEKLIYETIEKHGKKRTS